MALSAVQKRRIVEMLSQGNTPTDCVKALQEEYTGISVTRQMISHYDPRTLAGANLAPDLRALFYDLRKKFNESLDDIPLSSRAFRLNVLQKIVDTTESNKIKIDIVELAEKMCGDMFVKGKSDAPDPDAGRVPLERFESALDEIYGKPISPPGEVINGTPASSAGQDDANGSNGDAGPGDPTPEQPGR